MFWVAHWKRLFSVLLVFSFFTLGLQTQANAGIVGTDQLLASEQLQHDKQQLQAWLARADVRKQLIDLGVDVDAASHRVNSMTADEVKQLAAHMQDMPAGSGFAETAVLAFIVLVILEVTGVTDVLPNI